MKGALLAAGFVIGLVVGIAAAMQMVPPPTCWDDQMVDHLPVGLAAYELEEGQDPAQAVLVGANQAAVVILGDRMMGGQGRTIVDLFPPLGKPEGQQVLRMYALVVEEQVFADLGIGSYGDTETEGTVLWHAVIPSEAGFVSVFVPLGDADADGIEWDQSNYERAYLGAMREMGKRLESRLTD